MRGARLAVALTVSLVSEAVAAGLFLERSFAVPGVSRLDGMAFDPAGGTIFGVNAAGTPDTLFEFTPGGQLLATAELDFLPGVGGSRSLAFDSDTGLLLLGDFTGGRIYAFSTSGALSRSIALSDGYFFGAMAYDPLAGSAVLLGGLSGGAPSILDVDLATGEVTVGFQVPSGYSRGMGFDGARLVFLSNDNSTILRMDRLSGAIVDTSPSGLGIDDSAATFGGGRLFVWNDPMRRVEVFVPEPGVPALLAMAVGLRLMKRRRLTGHRNGRS